MNLVLQPKKMTGQMDRQKQNGMKYYCIDQSITDYGATIDQFYTYWVLFY